MPACHYCKTPIDPQSSRVWRRVHGWERKATASSRKSGSDITLRQPSEVYACDDCIRRLKRGLAPTQATLM